MARRKSRKNADAKKRPAVVNEPGAAAALADGAAKAPEAEASAAPAGRKVQPRGAAPEGGSVSRPASAPPSTAASGALPSGRAVRLSTCIAGMALTLVLGLYLGTLLPGVLQDMRGQAGQQMASAPAPLPSAEAVPPSQSAPAAPPTPKAESARPHPGTTDPAAAGLPPGLSARLSELEAAVRKDPASAAHWTELGNLFFDAGRVHEAINAYERSLALAPGNADVLTDLGIMYRENDAPEKAVDCFRKAFAANPRHENALFNAGVVLYNDLGRKDEAVAAWRRLLALNPQARTPDGRTVLEMVRRLEEPPRR